MNVLDVAALSVSYGESPDAVTGVTVSVGKGEIVGIIGESGSGKTTVAMSVLGLLPPSAVVSARRFDVVGFDTTAMGEQELRAVRGARVAMIFQEPMSALNPCMRIGAQIGEVLELHTTLSKRERRAEAIQLLETVRVQRPSEQIDRYPHQLSGGQRQRVMIAMAIAAKPDLLVADEPTTALDVTVQARILELLVELRDRLDMGVLIISHDLGLIGQVCERVLVMRHGEVVEEGPTRQVLDSPQHAYTKALLRSVPRLTRPPRTRLSVVQDHSETAGVFPVEVVEERPIEDSVLLRFEHVGKTYAASRRVRNEVLRDISFGIRKGECFGIVGESGSGKSTMARIALALDDPTQGRVLFDGADISGLSARARRSFHQRAQMVFQDPNDSLDPRYTIGSSIAESLTHLRLPRDEARDRVIEVIEMVGMDRDVLARRPHAFSGGQRQRIAIARAMAPRPDFVVLDEPTSALDVSVQAQILNLLIDVQRQTSVSYMFISHDLAVVRHLSHRMAVLRDGEIVESGDALHIFDNPQHPYTRELLASIPEEVRAG